MLNATRVELLDGIPNRQLNNAAAYLKPNDRKYLYNHNTDYIIQLLN